MSALRIPELGRRWPVFSNEFFCLLAGFYFTKHKTSSTKKKKGLFGKNDKNAVTVTVLLTRHWLIWVTEEKTMEVRSARLQDLVVVDYKDTASYKLIPDSGVQITGPFTGWVGTDKTQYLSYFIGLGEEPVAAKFKKALIHSVQDVKVK
jgi:hypothetical protein